LILFLSFITSLALPSSPSVNSNYVFPSLFSWLKQPPNHLQNLYNFLEWDESMLWKNRCSSYDLKIKIHQIRLFFKTIWFFMAQKYYSKIEKQYLIVLRWNALIYKIILHHTLLREFWSYVNKLFFERKFKFVFVKEIYFLFKIFWKKVLVKKLYKFWRSFRNRSRQEKRGEKL